VATVTWPYWPASRRWGNEGRRILEEEVLRQNGGDGVNLEQAISYQQFVLDFLILAALAGRAHGIEFSKGYWLRVEAMLEYIASLMDVGGNVPMFGDADDGYVVKLAGEEDGCPYRSLLCMGAFLFQRTDFLAKAGGREDAKTRWLLGARASRPIPEWKPKGGAKLPVRRAFPEGGYYILGRGFETEREMRCVIDCGPLGYLSIAAHGHADALSIYLSVSGREFLIDPGTYAYHTKKKWRDYFRGTSAHNTVRIDGENQSVIAGPFMWADKAKAWCDSFSCGDHEDRFSGRHDGYRRLKDPVVHRREVRVLKEEDRIEVIDFIDCSGEHSVERFWHFPERCSVKLEGRRVVASNDGIEVSLEAPDHHGDVEIFHGDEQTPLGWVSRRFDVKVPAATAVWGERIRGKTVLRTTITIKNPTGPA
jgi:hypothetical protein